MILTRIRETIIKAQDFPVKLIVFIGVAIFMTVYFFPRFKNQIMHPNKSARLMDLQMALEQNEIADRGNLDGAAAMNRSVPMAVKAEDFQIQAAAGRRVVASDPAAVSADADRKMIRTAHMDIQVTNFDEAFESLNSRAKGLGAVVFGTNIQNPEGKGAYGSVTFLVEAEKLDSLMNNLGQLGTIKNRTLSANDVTESYVDLKSRLTNAEKVRERLIDILANRTGKLSDVLSMETEIGRIGETIERLKGQIRYIDDQSAKSRLEIFLHEAPSQIAPIKSNVVVQIQQTIKQSWNVFFGIIMSLIVLIGFFAGISVYLALGVLLFFLFKPFKDRLFKTL